MEIYTNGNISLAGHDTGLSVRQDKAGTVLYRRETISGVAYAEIPLPRNRYALAVKADREALEAQVLAYCLETDQ